MGGFPTDPDQTGAGVARGVGAKGRLVKPKFPPPVAPAATAGAPVGAAEGAFAVVEAPSMPVEVPSMAAQTHSMAIEVPSMAAEAALMGVDGASTPANGGKAPVQPDWWLLGRWETAVAACKTPLVIPCRAGGACTKEATCGHVASLRLVGWRGGSRRVKF